MVILVDSLVMLASDLIPPKVAAPLVVSPTTGVRGGSDGTRHRVGPLSLGHPVGLFRYRIVLDTRVEEKVRGNRRALERHKRKARSALWTDQPDTVVQFHGRGPRLPLSIHVV